MSIQKTVCHWVILGWVAAGVGCAGARYEMRDADQGIVAIPENTNTFPNYYQDAAQKKIREHVGPDYVVINSYMKEAAAQTMGLPGTPSNPKGKKEWWIEYVKKGSPAHQRHSFPNYQPNEVLPSAPQQPQGNSMIAPAGFQSNAPAISQEVTPPSVFPGNAGTTPFLPPSN